MKITVILKSLLFVIFISFLACSENEKQIDKSIGELKKDSEEMMTDAKNKIVEAEKNVMEKVSYDFLEGKWSGKFDGRNTTLSITDIDANSFKGKINIKYRNEINQEVTGYYNPEDNSITMEDQLHSRYKGKYEGKLSDDKMSYAGQFTMKLDGKKFNFNLKKK